MSGSPVEGPDETRPPSGPVTVLIADDDASIRSGLEKIIGLDDSLRVVAVATDAREAVSLARDYQPAVALVDVNMPGGGGPHATAGIRANSPRTRVIGHSVHDDRAAVMEMVRSGAVGYIVKGATGDAIRDTLRRAGRGQSTLSGEVVSTIVYELAALLQTQDQVAAGRRAQVADARRLISGEGVTFVADPVFELRSGDYAGAEARAVLAGDPAVAIDAALDLADTVGYRVEAERALVALALRDIHPPGGFLALTASAATLTSPGFSDLVVGGETPLIIQLSGASGAADYPQLKAAIGFLRHRGARVAVTGIGQTAHATSHALELRPEVLKLDPGLVARLDGDPAEATVFRSSQAFAASLGAELWVDGLVGQRQLEAAIVAGARYGQGPYFTSTTAGGTGDQAPPGLR